MYRDKCILCNKYRNHKKKIKMFLYAFPRKDIEVYRKWLMVCDIEESVEKEVSPKVCDQCFEIDDFYPLIGNETRRKLKNNSFPIRKESLKNV